MWKVQCLIPDRINKIYFPLTTVRYSISLSRINGSALAQHVQAALPESKLLLLPLSYRCAKASNVHHLFFLLNVKTNSPHCLRKTPFTIIHFQDQPSLVSGDHYLSDVLGVYKLYICMYCCYRYIDR